MVAVNVGRQIALKNIVNVFIMEESVGNFVNVKIVKIITNDYDFS